MAESLPTSLSAFSSRRRRADSMASFTYHQDDEDALSTFDGQGEIEDFGFEDDEVDIDRDSLLAIEEDIPDYISRRRSSTLSRISTRDHLLRRDSLASAGSARTTKRLSQKTYLVNEDLTMVVAGFETSRIGYAAYLTLCIFTLGVAYLLFRWLPKWYVAVVGKPCPLGECRWVVIEVRPYCPCYCFRLTGIDHCPLESMGRDGHPQRGDETIWASALHRVWLHR